MATVLNSTGRLLVSLPEKTKARLCFPSDTTMLLTHPQVFPCSVGGTDVDPVTCSMNTVERSPRSNSSLPTCELSPESQGPHLWHLPDAWAAGDNK